jgi:hypothetical protein
VIYVAWVKVIYGVKVKKIFHEWVQGSSAGSAKGILDAWAKETCGPQVKQIYFWMQMI